MEIIETDWKGSLVEMLDSIFALEDSEPRKGTKAHKEWKIKIQRQYIAFNQRVERHAFKETI